MKWSIPGKTFFLGEYAAIAGAPAILLTTAPCFELTLTEEPGLQGIHPDSPAGRLWTQQGKGRGLLWNDPYNGCGGLGASSAQWLGAFYASNYLQKIRMSRDDMLQAYFRSAWQGMGIRPSGYDVLAQSMHGCVYINQQKSLCHAQAWPFDDLAFILLHTGQKLATHQHLESLTLTEKIEQMIEIVESAKSAFESVDSQRVIEAVNAYHHCLLQQGLVAKHSLQQIKLLKKNTDLLAIKGCGAMGADVLLLLMSKNKLAENRALFIADGMKVLATSENLHAE